MKFGTGLTRAHLLSIFLLCSHRSVQAALNIDGSRAVEPATKNDDPSPIDDPDAYHPEQHDCPLPCIDYANAHTWITYFSINRLRHCPAPMLLQFSISRPLVKPGAAKTTSLIRGCTLASLSETAAEAAESLSPAGKLYASQMQNPRMADDLMEVGVDTAAACAARGVHVSGELKVISSSSSNNRSSNRSSSSGDSKVVGGEEVARLLEGMRLYFENEDNCDETFLGERTAERVIGIAVDPTGDLAGIQQTALDWSRGKCAANIDQDLQPIGRLAGASVYDIAGAPVNVNGTGLHPPSANGTSPETVAFHSRFRKGPGQKPKRSRAVKTRAATCDHVKVQRGDGCPSLVVKCGITPQEFVRYNPKPGLCGNLKENEYVCCSSGDPYKPPKPDAPKAGADGTCATHMIKNGDSCESLARQNGITVDDLEKWNKNKTWAWTVCKDMLIDYNMCLSPGRPPMPPPQEGAQCGPLVPGTKAPSSSSSMSLADLNPCPLKACCSNWGFCGVFPAHCEVKAPKGGGPGTKLPDAPSTCVSNCGTEIKENSGPPSSFGRIGYYESWNMGRDCLWMKAADANTDGSYTHMHWGFLDIDPETWKPVVRDPHGQWKGFKALPEMKRVVSLGGWAYSTEAPTHDILRRAIIDNRELFATNLAKFAKDEGLDGVDIDWEYPGAPDIYVDGQTIGKKTDGIDYLKFLTVLKQKVPSGVEVSIAAPASYWYLKAFPIDRIASVIDYIVYMTYDLHGQWDHGNPNAYDQCDSGKCIRSHVNLTETNNALAMITKAGVPNNKIFVGEASYGRSFRMAKNGCWGPLCEFTGTRNRSEAAPGRCTDTAGYLANAEIEELVKRGGASVRAFHDKSSGSDVLLHDGDYISYMTPAQKDVRRTRWKGRNFAGSIDWAVDLQFFGDADMSETVDRVVDDDGESCVSGTDVTDNSGDLCEFSCALGFCPDTLCECKERGPTAKLPDIKGNSEYFAIDMFDVDLNRLCKFGCKYGYCPRDVCEKPPKPDAERDDDPKPPPHKSHTANREANARNCFIFKDKDRIARLGHNYDQQCYGYCQKVVEEAIDDGRITNYGCAGFWPLGEEIPWQREPGFGEVTNGQCECDNWLVNQLAEFVVEALPMIAQIGCYLLMSSLKLVLDIGLNAFPPGRAVSASLDMAATAAQTVNYLYDDDNDPYGAFEWWLAPCGGSDLVPDELKEVFGVLGIVTDGISYKQPKKFKKGSGKKGDDGNPKDKDRGKPGGGGSGGGVTKPKPKPKCRIPKGRETVRLGRAGSNTLREDKCVGDKTVRQEWVVSSLDYAQAAKPTVIDKACDKAMGQACYHYSSVIRENPQWATLTCPPEAAATAHRQDGVATDTWVAQHSAWHGPGTGCDRDEYPPAYLLGPKDPALVNGGLNTQGQMVRPLPGPENQRAGGMWKGACFGSILTDMTNAELKNGVQSTAGRVTLNQARGNIQTTQTSGRATSNKRPEFVISSWFQSANPPADDGLRMNTCWPKQRASQDPGYALLTYDKYYNGKSPPYDYQRPYMKGQNGS